MKTYNFMKWLLELTIKFPKSQRFVMAKRIEEAVLAFHDLLILAVKEEGDKRATMNKVGIEFQGYFKLTPGLKATHGAK